MRKTNLVLLLCALMMLAPLPACGHAASPLPFQSLDEGAHQPETPQPGAEAQPPFQDFSVEGQPARFQLERDLVLSVACSSRIAGTTRGEIFDLCAQKLSDWTDGRMTLQLYDGGVLGGDAELIEALEAGTVDLMMCDQSSVLSTVPELSAISIHGLYGDLDACNAAMAEFAGLIQPYFTAHNLHLLSLYADTFSLITSNPSLLNRRDLQSLTIRVGNDVYRQAFWQALGCNAVPMSLSNTYLALQQGEINAAELFWNGILDHRIYELQDFVLCPAYIPSFSVVLVSQITWSQLSQTEQQAIQQMYDYKAGLEIAYEQQLNQRSCAVAEEHGMTVTHELPAEIRTAFDSACEAVTQLLRKDIGDELVEEYLALARRYAG